MPGGQFGNHVCARLAAYRVELTYNVLVTTVIGKSLDLYVSSIGKQKTFCAVVTRLSVDSIMGRPILAVPFLYAV